MKKTGVINSGLSGALAQLGHTDLLILSDAGFPVPMGVPQIDLALRPGTPRTMEILEVIDQEIVVEGLVMAEEAKQFSPGFIEWLEQRFPLIEIEFMPHTEFKKMSLLGKTMVRSGDISPYSNVIVRVGVPY
ncbi:MAG: D-ribose pyranase [Bacilli bacterium]